jgi:DNA-binding NtrC family response regulator
VNGGEVLEVEERARILVVDDERDLCDYVRLLLEREGYIVDEAYDGAEALRKLQKERFALVLADIRMPIMDGLEMLHGLREVSKDVVVILMTAYSSLETAFEALQYGVTDYLTKPFEDRSQLISAVERGLNVYKERMSA